MPYAPQRPCPHSGCPTLTTGGLCPAHARQSIQRMDQQRGTAHARGYTYGDWQPFRRRFLATLVDAGITPVCGAALPTGPRTRDSLCLDAGLLTFTSADGSSLHLDHEPSLEDWERRNPTIVCDLNRIVLKCAACHARKTHGIPHDGDVRSVELPEDA